MIIAREVTEWAAVVANNIYVFNDSMTKMIAYVPEGSDRVQKFKQPIEFDRRGRKFEELPGGAKKPTLNRRAVNGSKGEVYYVTQSPDGGLHCTCLGFNFKGKCRHLDLQVELTT